MKTKYKIIAEFSDYAVGTDGSICRRGSFLKTHLMHNGYKRVILCAPNGKRRRALVHRLVLEAFVGPCPRGMEACHENGIRDDNRLSNLRWDTRKNNFADRDRHGTTARGTRHGMVKLSEADVLEIRKRRAAGARTKDLGKQFGVRHSTISSIALGRTWSHVKC